MYYVYIYIHVISINDRKVNQAYILSRSRFGIHHAILSRIAGVSDTSRIHPDANICPHYQVELGFAWKMWKTIKHYTTSCLLEVICCTKQIKAYFFQSSIHQMFATFSRYIRKQWWFHFGSSIPISKLLQSDAWCRQVICSRMQVRLGRRVAREGNDKAANSSVVNQNIHHDLMKQA